MNKRIQIKFKYFSNTFIFRMNQPIKIQIDTFVRFVKSQEQNFHQPRKNIQEEMSQRKLPTKTFHIL